MFVHMRKESKRSDLYIYNFVHRYTVVPVGSREPGARVRSRVEDARVTHSEPEVLGVLGIHKADSDNPNEQEEICRCHKRAPFATDVQDRSCVEDREKVSRTRRAP